MSELIQHLEQEVYIMYNILSRDDVSFELFVFKQVRCYRSTKVLFRSIHDDFEVL